MRTNAIAIAAIILSSVGCTTRHADRPAPTQPAIAFSGVRVVGVDGTVYFLNDAQIRTDSVVGVNAAGRRIAIARSEISAIDERRAEQTPSRPFRVSPAAILLAVAAMTVAITGF